MLSLSLYDGPGVFHARKCPDESAEKAFDHPHTSPLPSRERELAEAKGHSQTSVRKILNYFFGSLLISLTKNETPGPEEMENFRAFLFLPIHKEQFGCYFLDSQSSWENWESVMSILQCSPLRTKMGLSFWNVPGLPG